MLYVKMRDLNGDFDEKRAELCDFVSSILNQIDGESAQKFRHVYEKTINDILSQIGSHVVSENK